MPDDFATALAKGRAPREAPSFQDALKAGRDAAVSGVRSAIFGDAGTEDALPLSDDEKLAYMKRLYPGQDVDPGSEVLSPAEQESIYAKYKAEPWNVAPDSTSPEFTRRTSIAAFDKTFGPVAVKDRAKVEEILARHAPKEASAGERAQYLGGQFMEGMNAPAMGYARTLFGRGGVLENPASLEAAENVSNPSRKSIGDARYEAVRRDVESTFVGRTLAQGAHLAGATPGLVRSGRAMSPVVGATAAGPAALGLNALASSGGDVAAAGEGVLFGGLAAGLSVPMKAFISRLPVAMQRPAVDRLLSMAAGGTEFAAADAILHGPDGERALANFIFGAGMKATGATPGQTRAKELTTSTATYPDPVEAARGVRGAYDEALARVESSKPDPVTLDPVAEARATAAQFPREVAPEPTAPQKPVSEAPKAPVEAPVKPADATPEAPKSKTLIGTDRYGSQVWEIAGRYYVKDKAGRYGIAHPEALADARKSAATPEAAPATPDVAAPRVEARPIEAAAKVDPIKEVVAASTPQTTEMFAGGPEAISTKAHSIWTGLRDTVAEGAKSLRTFFSSQKSPELLAESPKAWRHVVAADAAPSIAKEAFGVWKAEVPDKAWSPQDAAKFEAALTENNRLGAVDARRADAARKMEEAKSLRDQAAKMGALQGPGRPLALAQATTMVKSALRLEREAKVLTERAYRAESKDEYLYGPGKPFTSREELREFVARPDVVEAAARHAAWWKEMVEPRYKASIQADESAGMPGRGRFFDARASLVAERGESPVGGAGLVAGRTENLRVRKSRFAKTAFGDAAQGYKTAAEDYIPAALTDVIPKGEWRAAIDTLVKEGKAAVVKPGQKPPEEIGGEKAMPFDIGPGKDPVYMPKRLHDILYRIRQTAPKAEIPVVSAVANKATSEAMAMGLDNIFHIFRSMGVTMTRPGSAKPLREAALETVAWPIMRVLDAGRLLRRVFAGMDPRGRLEMAEAGVAERGDSYRRDPKTGEVMMGPDGKPLPMESNIYGLRWLGKLGDAMDRAGRQELFDVMRRMKAAGVNIDTSPEAISKFVGQMGRYGRAWYGPTQQWVSDTGLNRFFEAWRNARGNAGRTLTLNSGLTPKDAKTAAKLRLVMLSKLAGMFTTAGIINTITDGSPFGKSDVPVGAIVLKRDEKTGKATTLDFFKMFGIRQVMNALGITAAIDAARTGGTVGQAATNASQAFGAELTRPFSGPLPTAVSIGITGSRPDQVARNQGDAMVPASATEGGLLRRRAVEATKALFPLHSAVAETGARALGLDQIRDILNIGEEVTPDMVDEMSEMLRTFSVGRTLGADKTDSLPERSKMGYLFGTYVDAVKEDIRKAPPEKIEAVVSKAFADIDARDDIDNGTKARLKKAVQMYAISRTRGR